MTRQGKFSSRQWRLLSKHSQTFVTGVHRYLRGKPRTVGTLSKSEASSAYKILWRRERHLSYKATSFSFLSLSAHHEGTNPFCSTLHDRMLKCLGTSDHGLNTAPCCDTPGFVPFCSFLSRTPRATNTISSTHVFLSTMHICTSSRSVEFTEERTPAPLPQGLFKAKTEFQLPSPRQFLHTPLEITFTNDIGTPSQETPGQKLAQI